jgi:hypothetical protein
MPKYPFLSDEWVIEAHRIYLEVEAAGGLAGVTVSPVRLNLIVTEAPFSDRPIDAHVDTTSGRVAISIGHLPAPDVTVSMGYGTARALFVSGDMQAVMQAFMGGRIRVDGDLSKLLDPRSGIWPAASPSWPAPSPAGGGSGPAGGGNGPAGGGSGPAGGPPHQPELGSPGKNAQALAARLKEITE